MINFLNLIFPRVKKDDLLHGFRLLRKHLFITLLLTLIPIKHGMSDPPLEKSDDEAIREFAAFILRTRPAAKDEEYYHKVGEMFHQLPLHPFFDIKMTTPLDRGLEAQKNVYGFYNEQLLNLLDLAHMIEPLRASPDEHIEGLGDSNRPTDIEHLACWLCEEKRMLSVLDDEEIIERTAKVYNDIILSSIYYDSDSTNISAHYRRLINLAEKWLENAKDHFHKIAPSLRKLYFHEWPNKKDKGFHPVREKIKNGVYKYSSNLKRTFNEARPDFAQKRILHLRQTLFAFPELISIGFHSSNPENSHIFSPMTDLIQDQLVEDNQVGDEIQNMVKDLYIEYNHLYELENFTLSNLNHPNEQVRQKTLSAIKQALEYYISNQKEIDLKKSIFTDLELLKRIAYLWNENHENYESAETILTILLGKNFHETTVFERMLKENSKIGKAINRFIKLNSSARIQSLIAQTVNKNCPHALRITLDGN